MRDRRLPRALTALVEWIVSEAIARESLIGDLEERYTALGDRGPLRRAMWVGGEAVAITTSYAGVRLRAGHGNGGNLVDALRGDLTYVVRNLFRRPGFAGLVVATLALGIGANTAIFSVVKGLFLQALPFEQGERLVLINQQHETGFTASVTLPNYRDWKERTSSFDRFSAILPGSATLSRPDGARVVEVGWVHGGFFETLGVEAALGRVFTEAESEPGGAPVAVLGHAFWTTELGGDPDVVGGTIRLGDEPWTVVGIMPPDFVPYGEVLLYLPMGYVASTIAWDDRGTGSGTEIFARLAPGVSVRGAQADLEAVAVTLRAEFGPEAGVGNLTALRSWYLGDTGRQVILLMITVALVLLCACANVTNLLLVRGENRRGEIAVRRALGAARGRIYRQLLTESLVFGVLGALGGIVVGTVGLELLLKIIGDALPLGFADRITIDGGVLLFTGAISVATAAAAGVWPAIRSVRDQLAHSLRDAARTVQSGGRARAALVSVEVALSLTLLVGAGLLIQSLSNLQRVEKGFDGSEVLTLRLRAPASRYPTREQWSGFYSAVEERVRALPGVISVAASNHFPLSGNSWEKLYRDENTPANERGESVLLTMVSPSYFDTYDVELREGRGLMESDVWGGDNVAVVDETLAAARWPGQSALGRRITFEEVMSADGELVDIWRTVVGVVQHVRHYELTSPSRIEVYTSLAQSASWGFTTYLSVKADGDPGRLTPAVRAVVAEMDSEIALFRIRTMQSVMDQQFGVPRAMQELLIVFAALTLLMGCVGIYSVVSHTTSLRVREVGVRIALGGEPRRMIALIVRDSMAPVLSGIVLGLGGAAVLGRLLGAVLFEVAPVDPSIMGLAAVTLAAVAILSTLVPAFGAARVEPASALRAD